MHDADVGDDVVRRRPDGRTACRSMPPRFSVSKRRCCFPPGTQSNLAALMSHCQRGEEVILGSEAHSYRYEAGGLGGARLDPAAGRAEPARRHAGSRWMSRRRSSPTIRISRARSLLALGEHHHRTRAAAEIPWRMRSLFRERRIFPSISTAPGSSTPPIAQNMSVKELCAGFDSVSSCLSKGLRCAGRYGPAGKKPNSFEKAKRARKILGGGMRQAGVIAAAGLHALEHNTARLREEPRQRRAARQGLARPRPRGAAQPPTWCCSRSPRRLRSR